MAPTTRHGALSGLRQLLDHLDAHPSLPVPTTVTVDVHAENDLAGFEAVARAAHQLCVTPVSTPNGTQRAAKKFGPVTYAVVYHPIHAAVTP